MSQGTMVAGGDRVRRCGRLRYPTRRWRGASDDLGGVGAGGARGQGGGRRSASGGHRHDTCDDEDDGGRRIIPIDDRARGCGGGNPMPAREGWTLERGQADADNNLQTSPH